MDEHEQAAQLLEEAQAILRVLRVGARRAFVLEVTGTPKAGKTSALGLLHGFFKRAGFRVYMLRERASDCPIPMKGHFYFNAWTTCTMLAEVLATYDTDVDIIILDRGFFDALIWLGLQLKRGQVSEGEALVIRNFVLLERWRKLVDLTIVMTVQPDVAMTREDKGVLVRRTGSLMNVPALTEFNAAISETIAAHAADFDLLQIDASADTGPKAGALGLLHQLLPIVRRWGQKQVLVLPRPVVKEAFEKAAFLHDADAATRWGVFQTHMRMRLRHEVESVDDLVQVVGCGIVVHEDSLFVLTRASKDEKNSYGRSTLWKGCHVGGSLPLSIDGVAEQVRLRVLEELHLSTPLKLELLGMTWLDDDDPELLKMGLLAPESRHMGVVFLVRVENAAVAQSMQDKEFRKAGRGHVMVGTFQTPKEILRSLSDLGLEPWSRFAVENIGLKEPS